MTQLFLKDSLATAQEDHTGSKYWIVDGFDGTYQAYCQRPDGAIHLQASAPVVVMSKDLQGHVVVSRLDSRSTEDEIEAFCRQYNINMRQKVWCFRRLEELNPVEYARYTEHKFRDGAAIFWAACLAVSMIAGVFGGVELFAIAVVASVVTWLSVGREWLR